MPFRTSLDVRCPRCAARATFDEPFEFLVAPPAEATTTGDPRPVHRWGGWYVRERFPALVRWRAPRGPQTSLVSGGDPRRTGGYHLRHRGVVRCPSCHHVAVHVLRWPDDAFFQWEVRGTRLWAEDAAFARVLLHYVESVQRDPALYQGHERTLRRLPAAALVARNRTLVGRRIRQSLEAALVSTEPPPLRRRV